MKRAGRYVLGGALLLGGYALFIYDPTVSSGYGNTYNIGKLNFQQNLVMAAGVGAMVGVLMMLFGDAGNGTRCKHCAEVIKTGASVCKHCGGQQKDSPSPTQPKTYWVCGKCNETTETIKNTCWNCGAHKV